MRKRNNNGAFSVNAISGTYVVTLGMNADEDAAVGLLGFAIHRTDHIEDEAYWLKGFRVFEETDPGFSPGVRVSTKKHPIQSFLWADYTAKPDYKYTYKVVPVFGTPSNLEYGDAVEVTVETEAVDQGKHAVYFNRGVAASQAYARRFQNRKPDKVPNNAAFDWLSRGLLEGMLDFIGTADGPRYGLRAAVYEFYYKPVLDKFRKAVDNGADVKIVYDLRKDHPGTDNKVAVENAGLSEYAKGRKQHKSYISHNKFIVLLEDGEPIEVWTGSTNITRGAIFGHLNVGHIVRDSAIARKYLDYWEQLQADPENRELKKWIMANTPDPTAGTDSEEISPIFSPRPGGRTRETVLDWYAKKFDSAERSAMITFAFNVDRRFRDVLGVDKDYLRYVLRDKRGKSGVEIGYDDYDVLTAYGTYLKGDELYRWTKKEKSTGYNSWVKYIHTKFMLVDPLSDNPTVVTGSANFSENSTVCNDENMLIIRGDKRVADIYLGEFMRIFNHYYFRKFVREQSGEEGAAKQRKAYLKPDDSWCESYFNPRKVKFKRRLLFG
ncbi:MAG: hypothetical protein GY771_11010 [bacterium]|nr:hypothetical protein [bacterium]